MKVLVIGACNIDILGYPRKELIESDSNIGEVVFSLGGVAKNIAENLFNLGMNVDFLTQIGKDVFRDYVGNYLDSLGIFYKKSFLSNKSNIFMGLFNHEGEFALGVNDLASIENLEAENFEELDEYISNFDCLVFDTNLKAEVLEFLIRKYAHKLIFVDGVSQAKVMRVKNLLNSINVLKLNVLELNALLETKSCDIIEGIKKLHSLGVENVIISQGKEAIYYSILDEVFQTKVVKPKKIVSSNGAGDALFSGIIYKYDSTSFHQAIEFGKVLAAKTLEVYSACNKDISNI